MVLEFLISYDLYYNKSCSFAQWSLLASLQRPPALLQKFRPHCSAQSCFIYSKSVPDGYPTHIAKINFQLELQLWPASTTASVCSFWENIFRIFCINDTDLLLITAVSSAPANSNHTFLKYNVRRWESPCFPLKVPKTGAYFLYFPQYLSSRFPQQQHNKPRKLSNTSKDFPPRHYGQIHHSITAILYYSGKTKKTVLGISAETELTEFTYIHI